MILENHLVSEKLKNVFENARRSLQISENSYIIDTDSKSFE